jgi:hypothetical protein
MRTLPLLSLLLVACSAAGPMAKRVAMPDAMASAPATGGTAPGPGAAALPDEKLVVTGFLSMAVDNGPAAMATIHSQVESAGGRVVHEQESGHDYGWTGHLTVRVPPGQVTAFVDGLAAIGSITSRRIEASDVSREYFDQELALTNNRVTLDRLQALLGNAGLTTADVLEIEREMTRVRGEIERIEGEHRFLEDRIAYATFDLDLVGSGAVVLSPKARVHPGARASLLYLIDAPTGTDRVRLGVGGTLWFRRASSVELDVYPSTDDGTGRAVLVTAGGATYSDFFGAGRRRWLNPFLGGRLGYAYLDATSRFVVSGELGLELYKGPHVIVDAAARLHGFIGKNGVEPAAQMTAGLVVPF